MELVILIEANKSVLIVAKSGRIGDGLRALLKNLHQVNIIDRVDDSLTVQEIITNYNPDLVLLVTNLSHQGAWQLLEYLRDKPQTKCLVLTNTSLHMEQAEAAGADEALLIGFPTQELFETVTRLLSV